MQEIKYYHHKTNTFYFSKFFVPGIFQENFILYTTLKKKNQTISICNFIIIDLNI